MVISVAGGVVASGLDAPPLIRLLADGRLHSGEWLAERLGSSRAAVWKRIERLRRQGIAIEALPRRGYRLPNAIELLDVRRIRGAIDARRAPRVKLDLEFEVDSTNSRLLASAPPPRNVAHAMLSELQHAGRGRRGKSWTLPFGGGIALSLGWFFEDASRADPSLSLGVGVAVVRALERAGAVGIGVKWPNDIWFGDRKLGGVLLELRAEASGPAYVVIGVGINVTLDTATRARLEASGVSVAAVADACVAPPSRNFIAGAIIDELLSMLAVFEREGFAAFREAWTTLDVLRGRSAQVALGDDCIQGTARGVDAHGALRLERDGRLERFVSGEVSLRSGGESY